MKHSGKIIYLFILLVFSSSCKEKELTPDTNGKIITVFYTNDEHGWMESTDEYGGASGMVGIWEAREAYDDSDSYLVLSGGDMWTGPAISTWFEGESMVEVLNQMGYDAAAIGNHEFDFTTDVLNIRLQQMNFPLLAANIYEKGTENVPSFAKPYVIKIIDGINVGIIGLASLSTPYTSFPAYVAAYEFTDYTEAVEKYAPVIQGEGADIIIIIGHICLDEMQSLVPVANKYNIPLIGGGHCHRSALQESNGVLLMQTNGELREYVKVELSFDETTKVAKVTAKEAVPNQGNYANSEVQTIVDYWESETANALSEEIGYCSQTIGQSSVGMGNMVCDSWFYTFPEADVTITNAGGIRQDIVAGAIQLESIVGLLPFNNSILRLKLTGTELLDCIDNYLVGGMTTIGGNFLSDGNPIEGNKTYTVLTTDYLYSLSNSDFSKYDSAPENTSVHYRQPLIDWIKSLNTNSADPLNNYLDNNPRR